MSEKYWNAQNIAIFLPIMVILFVVLSAGVVIYVGLVFSTGYGILTFFVVCLVASAVALQQQIEYKDVNLSDGPNLQDNDPEIKKLLEEYNDINADELECGGFAKIRISLQRKFSSMKIYFLIATVIFCFLGVYISFYYLI